MQTIQFRQKVGDDGVLRLEVQGLPHGEEVEAVLVMQPGSNGQNASLDRVDALYGSCADDPIERPAQGHWEEREELV